MSRPSMRLPRLCWTTLLVIPLALFSAQPPGTGPSLADTSRLSRKWLDLAYAGQSQAQKLDLYLPTKGQGPFPVVVHVHGGGFMVGDKADGQLTPVLAALDRGLAVASVNYRLSGEALFPAQVRDVKAAIRWLRVHAGTYGLDSRRFAVWGGSAGGHLASLVGTTGDATVFSEEGEPPGSSTRVQAVVDWFGPIDFSSMDEQFRKSGKGQADHGEASSPESRLLGRPLAEVPELAKVANPATYLSADDPPFLIQHGTEDPLVPTEQSIHFAEALESVLGKKKVRLELIQGAGHGGPAFDDPKNLRKVLDFLVEALK